MTEEVLQHIWQFQLFEIDQKELNTVGGELLKVIHPGQKNYNQGPDFLNSRLLINDVEWNGHVEVHIRSSLWNAHKHQLDSNYKNVILHVVLEDDKPVQRSNGEIIPCIEVRGLIDANFINNYENLMTQGDKLPCASLLTNVRSITKFKMLERVLIERLDRKSHRFETWLDCNNGDWEQTAFEILAYCIGLKINAEEFHNLAHSINFKWVLKMADNPVQIEALLFGMAGFLNDELDDAYWKSLNKEFTFLAHKHQLEVLMLRRQWNFHRLRPASFPPIRIAQLGALIRDKGAFFSKLMAIESVQGLRELLSVSVSSYWKCHYDFGKPTKKEVSNLGKSKQDNILVNGVIPLLYLYYRKTNNQVYLNRVFHFLEMIKSESNRKTKYLENHFAIKSAYDSQAVLELYDYYCEKKNCLQCGIGCEVL